MTRIARRGDRPGLDAREQAALARFVDRVAHGCGASTTRYEPSLEPAASAPERADVVVSYDEHEYDVEQGPGGWRVRILDRASRAAKLLIVVLPNPDRVQLAMRSAGGGARDLVRLLWEIGRVRDHAYLVFPRAVEVLAAVEGQVVAPDVAQAPVGALVRRTAHLHAFVVDTTPRTRQARRRLRIAGASGDPA
jgi:hypothetical protein